jgi:gas vesicle protein
VGQTPDEIREQIEQTRSEMGDTAEALGYKANVPARTKGWVADKKDAVVSAVAGTKDSVASSVSGATSAVSDATPDGRQVKDAGRRVVGVAQENPIGLAIAGAAVGFVAGLFVPATRAENDRLGAKADQLKASARDAGQEALQHGKDVATATVQSAAETAREESQTHAGELQDSLQQKVHEASPASS